MKIFIICFCIILSSFVSCNSDDTNDNNSIKVGTFNIAWLGDGNNDKINRTEVDYERIANIINTINPDILGLEEIENSKAIERLIKYLPSYKYSISDNGSEQNLCFLYRSELNVEYLGLYTPLSVDSANTRAGAIVKVKKGNFDFLMLLVHLKSTSRYDSTTELKDLARSWRTQQAEVIVRWADSVLSLANEKDIIILGDFNDTPKRQKYASLTPILNSNSLSFLTAEIKSCRFRNWYSIDHIVVSNNAKQRFITNSELIFDFNSSLSEIEAKKVSDHCPVTVRFEVISPDND